MKKILISILLCVTLAAQLTVGYAFVYTPFSADGVVASTPVSVELTDADAAAVSNVADATEISASCVVRPGSEFDGTPVLSSIILVAYKDGCMVDYSVSSSVRFTSADDSAKKLSADFDNSTVGADGLKVYIWDSVDNARPLVNAGEYGVSGGVEAIIIGGEKVDIDADTKTGSVRVNAGYTEWPEVMVLTENMISGVSVEAKGEFPLSKNIHAYVDANIASPGTGETAAVTVNACGETYNISVTQEIPQITDVKFKQFMTDMTAEEYYSDSQVKIQYSVQNPVWTEDLPNPNINADGFTAGTNKVDPAYAAQFKNAVSGLRNVSYVYSDRTTSHSQMTFFYFNVAPALVGSQAFTLPYPSSSVTSSETDNCFTFTIERSARIYMQNGSDMAPKGWTRAANLVGTQQTTKNIMYYEFWTNTAGGTVYTTNGNNVFYKDYDVEPGKPCTVSLPSGKKSPRIFVKYQSPNLVENSTYSSNGRTVNIKTTTVYKPVYKYDNLTAAEGKYAMLEYPNNGSTITIPYNAKGNILYATSVFTNPSTPTPERQGLVIVPDEIVGGTALVIPSSMADADTIEFDLNASSRVYVFASAGSSPTIIANIKNAIGEGWENTEFDPTGSGSGEDAISLAYRISANAYIKDVRNKSSFYKDFVVTPGESGHVTINLNKSMSDKRVIVVIKHLSE